MIRDDWLGLTVKILQKVVLKAQLCKRTRYMYGRGMSLHTL